MSLCGLLWPTKRTKNSNDLNRTQQNLKNQIQSRHIPSWPPFEIQKFSKLKTKEISRKFWILEITVYLHMDPSACYGYKIKHFQVKFPRSIFILTKLWAAVTTPKMKLKNSWYVIRGQNFLMIQNSNFYDAFMIRTCLMFYLIKSKFGAFMTLERLWRFWCDYKVWCGSHPWGHKHWKITYPNYFLIWTNLIIQCFK